MYIFVLKVFTLSISTKLSMSLIVRRFGINRASTEEK